MTDNFIMEATKRSENGTGSARALRRQNLVPAQVYGGGKDNLSIALSEKEIIKLTHRFDFTTTIVELKLEGKTVKALPKTYEINPLTDRVEHIDFIYLEEKQQKVSIPITFHGERTCVGVKRGGFFNKVMRYVPVICDPKKIPSTIEVDINKMRIGQSLRASALELPEGCKHARKDDFVVASVTGRATQLDREEAAAEASSS